MADEVTNAKIKLGLEEDASKKMEGIEKSVDGVSKSFDRLAENVGKGMNQGLGDATAKWDEATGRWKDSSGKFVKGSQEAGDSMAGFTKKGKTAASDSKTWLEEISTGAARHLGSLVVEAALAAGKAVADFTKSSISEAADFESTMNKFEAVGGLQTNVELLQKQGLSLEEAKAKAAENIATLGVMEQKALDMGQATVYSAGEAAEAMVNLAQGGFSAAQIEAEALASTLALADAGEVDLARAGEILSSQMGVWSNSADQANGTAISTQEAIDGIATASLASKWNVDDFSMALASTGLVAKNAGASYDETLTALASISSGFENASDGGTSMKAVFNNLQPATDTQASAMNELGLLTLKVDEALAVLNRNGIKVDPGDVDGIYKGLFKVGEEAGLSEKKLEKWVGQFSSSAFYDAEGNFIGMRDSMGLLQTATEDLTEADRARLLELAFGSDGMRAAISLAQQGAEGYDSFSKAMAANGSAADIATTKNKGFNFAMEQFEGTVETIKIALGSELLPILTDVMNNGVKPLVDGILGFITAVKGGGEPIAEFAKAFPILEKPISVIKGIFDFLSGKQNFTALVDLQTVLSDVFGEEVGTMITKVVTLIGNIGKSVTEMVTLIQEKWPEIAAIITPILQDIITFFNEQFGPIFDWAIKEIGEMVAFVQENMPYFLETFEHVMGEIKKAWDAVWPVLEPILKTAFALVKLALSNALDVIKGVVKTVMALLQGDWDTAWNTVKQTVVNIWENIKTFMRGLPDIFVGLGKNVIDGLIRGIESMAGAVFETLKDKVFGNAILGVKQFLGMKSPSKLFADIGADMIAGLTYGITSSFDQPMKALETLSAAMTSVPFALQPSTSGQGDRWWAPPVEATAPTTATPGGPTPDWMLDAHSRQETTVSLNVDGAVLAQILMQTGGRVIQQDRRRYG